MTHADIIRYFRLHANDKSSICIEIGLLSERIFQIERYIKTLAIDSTHFFSKRLSLIKLVRSRRGLLNLLLSTNTLMYDKVVHTLESAGYTRATRINQVAP